jgi:uncharacterized membrane protein HdeD (DUF308 family)
MMSSTTQTPAMPGLASGLAPLRAKWGWIVALGVVYFIVGLIALGSVVIATAASVLVVGVMMVIAGVAEVINAFQVKSWGKFLLWLLLGALYIVAGIIAFDNPLLAAVVLTLLLGATLVASGIVRIVLAFGMQGGTPWIWVVFSGVITLLLGIIILARWPVSSLYVLGIFLGVDLVLAGASWIAIGLGLKQRA